MTTPTTIPQPAATPSTPPTPSTQETASAAEQEALAAAGVLGRAAQAFRTALDEVHQADDPAWRAYAQGLDDATRRLQAELLVARVQLEIRRAHRVPPGRRHGALAVDPLHAAHVVVDDVVALLRVAAAAIHPADGAPPPR